MSQYPTDPGHLDRLFAGEFFGATQTAGVLLEYLAQSFVALAVSLFLLKLTFGASASRRRALSALLVLVVASLGLYLFAEGSFRLVHVAWPRTQGQPTKPSRIWTARYVALNSQGYRDSEWASRVAGPELRVLVIGDSFAYGVGIRDPRARFTGVLEARLNAIGRFRRVRVFNAGIPDTHSQDHLRMLRTLLWLDPDIVLLAYVFNDIEYLRPLPRIPVFNPQSHLARFSLDRLLMLNSHVFDQVLFRYRVYQAARNGGANEALRAYSDPELLRRHLDLLVRFFEETRAVRARFRLVPFDVAVRVGPAYEDRYRRFVLAAVERGIPVWSLDGLFDALPYNALIVNTWDHHPGEQADRLVGQWLADRIADDRTPVGGTIAEGAGDTSAMVERFP